MEHFVAAAQEVGVCFAATLPQLNTPKAETQVFEGFVKNGVVHLLNGELPDGVFVKVTRE